MTVWAWVGLSLALVNGAAFVFRRSRNRAYPAPRQMAQHFHFGPLHPRGRGGLRAKPTRDSAAVGGSTALRVPYPIAIRAVPMEDAGNSSARAKRPAEADGDSPGAARPVRSRREYAVAVRQWVRLQVSTADLGAEATDELSGADFPPVDDDLGDMREIQFGQGILSWKSFPMADETIENLKQFSKGYLRWISGARIDLAQWHFESTSGVVFALSQNIWDCFQTGDVAVFRRHAH